MHLFNKKKHLPIYLLPIPLVHFIKFNVFYLLFIVLRRVEWGTFGVLVFGLGLGLGLGAREKFDI